MSDDQSNSRAVIHALVKWADNRELAPDRANQTGPLSVQFDDIYFSGDGPAEASHVFIDGNDLPNRFQQATQFRIGELGFGTGLNFLLTQHLWNTTKKPKGAQLDFYSVEKFPLTADDLERAHEAWPGFAKLAAGLRQKLPAKNPGWHQIDIAVDIRLHLFYGEAGDGLREMDDEINAWFLDGFSPAKNPDMWTPALFEKMFRCSSASATLATFTVAGAVRRGLTSAGFSVAKQEGFGRKRHMLTGRMENGDAARSVKPWFQSPSPLAPLPPAAKSGTQVAIIGGGIAGASLAYSLRQKGFSPTIFDAEKIASGASGNPAGLIMPRLDAGKTPAALFFAKAYETTIGLLAKLQDASTRPIFSPCGVLQRASNADDWAKFDKAISTTTLPPDWVIKKETGIFFPNGGSVDPRSYVAALADGIEVRLEKAINVSSSPSALTLVTEKGSYTNFTAIILANAHGACELLETEASAFPVTAIAGQIDQFPQAPTPEHAIATGPYIAPCLSGGMIAGATYEKNVPGRDAMTSVTATKENLSAAQKILPEIADHLRLDEAIPRASFRCQTPDRLPIVGPLPDWQFYAKAYEGLRQGKQLPYPPGEFQPGIFVLSGLGSRGLVTAPLCADIIACALSGDPAPVDPSILEILHPARFFIRSIKRAGAPKAVRQNKEA